MFKAVLLPLAKQDIEKSAKWYNSRQEGLGNRFVNEVYSKVSFICENPEASAVRYDNVHCAVMETFPFMIHYFIDNPTKKIVIAAVFHTSLNPERWKKRKS